MRKFNVKKKQIGIKVYLQNIFDYEVHLLVFKSSMMSALKLVFPAKPWENYHVLRIMFREIMEVVLNSLTVLCRGSTNSDFFSFCQFSCSVAMFVKEFMSCAETRHLSV